MLNVPSRTVKGSMYACGENVELHGLRAVAIKPIEDQGLVPSEWEIALEFDPLRFAAVLDGLSSLMFITEIDGRTEIAIFNVRAVLSDRIVFRQGENVRAVRLSARSSATEDDAPADR